jgi:hypothetical protein
MFSNSMVTNPRPEMILSGVEHTLTHKTCFVRSLNVFKLHGPSPQANYTDRATAAFRRSNCQLLRIKGATWLAWRIPTAVFSVF